MTTQKRRLERIAAGINRRAARYGRRGVITAEQLARLGNVCAYCHVGLEPMQGSYDHAVAFDRGGQNSIDNIVRCCYGCQRGKFTKTPEEWARHQDTLVICALPGCGKTWQPRFAELNRGMARYCSLSHAAKSRWV